MTNKINSKESIALNPVVRPKNNQQFMAGRPSYKMQLRLKAIQEKNNK